MEKEKIIKEIAKMKAETEARLFASKNIFTNKYYEGVIDALEFATQLLNI